MLAEKEDGPRGGRPRLYELRGAPTEVKDEVLSLMLLGYLSGLRIAGTAPGADIERRRERMRKLFGTVFLFRRFSGVALDSWLPASDSLFDVAYAFERMSAPAEAKREGIFYTPRHVVARMVEECLARRGGAPRVVDPACGGGLFLLECSKALVERGGLSPADALSRCVFGVDRDPRAAELCRVLLEAQAMALGAREVPRAAVEAADSLLSPAKARRYDVVIGNPPYGLSRDSQISPAENAALKKRYEAYRNGKVNKYILFMARGLELLSEGGLMSYIVPNSWLGISGAAAIREALLVGGRLHSIDLHLYNVFPGASVEAVTLLFEKGAPSAEIVVRAFEGPDSAPVERRRVAVEACLADRERRIPVVGGAGSERLERKLARLARLGDAGSPFRPMIALQAYAAGKGSPPQTKAEAKSRAFHGTFKEDDSSFPYLEGADVLRYGLRWSGSYLRHGPWLAEPQKIERFSGPRVLVREILGSPRRLLSAAFAEEPMLYNKSILHVLPEKSASRRAVLALCGILNSRVASFWIMRFGRKSQRRLFPKVVNADLAGLPLPPWFEMRSHDLAVVVEALMNETDPSRARSLEESIESEVASLYGLDEAERRVMDAFLGAC